MTDSDRSELLAKIRKQVEFYFGDSNYPTDKFLRLEASKNSSSFIPLSVIASFSRMKSLTTDVAVIAEALEPSSSVEVSEDKTMVRRVAPIPSEDITTARSIYAKGFPEDTTLDQLMTFWSEKGTVLCIRMRRTKEKTFKGSVFVEFDSSDTANAIVSANDLKWNDQPLILHLKADYHELKRQERANNRPPKRAREDSENGEKKEKKKEEKKSNDAYEKGLLIAFSGVGEGATFRELKDAFLKHAPVAYVENKETSGTLRFHSAEEATAALKSLSEAELDIKGGKPTFRAVEGDEESEFWARYRSDASKKGGRGGYRGGRGGNKRRRTRD